MSNTDSFVDEVNEDLRRDRLFALMRRYGWIAIAGVLLLVGGAAYREYRAAQIRTAAQAQGDAMLAAVQDNTPEAWSGVEGVLARFNEAAALAEAGDEAAARSILDQIATTPDLGAEYADLAVLRAAMLGDDAAARRTGLSAISAPGAPYRLLALEQIAMIDLETGDTDAAIAGLKALAEDAEIPAPQKRRVDTILTALGVDSET